MHSAPASRWLSCRLLGLLALLLLWRQRNLLLFQKPRYRDTQKRKLFWRSSFQWLNDWEFSKRFRVSKGTFLLILRALFPSLKYKRGHSSPTLYFMPAEAKLAITLRYLAGGAMYDIGDNFGYDSASCHHAVKQTLGALLCTSLGKCKFHIDKTWLEEKAKLFSGSYSGNPISGRCVAAVNGIAIEIQKPPESFGPMQYQNRKGFHAIVCQGVCNATYRFLSFDCSSPGSTHDAVAFAKTSLFPILEGGLPGNHWIAGDAAYPLSGSLMKPYPHPSTIWERAYNTYHSQLCVKIENSFGTTLLISEFIWISVIKLKIKNLISFLIGS